MACGAMRRDGWMSVIAALLVGDSGRVAAKENLNGARCDSRTCSNSPTDRRQLGQQARQRIIDHFDRSRRRAYEDYFEQVATTIGRPSCGIAGFLQRETNADRATLDALGAGNGKGHWQHRGPDADGVWSDPQAGMASGSRRLSIIDSVTQAHNRCSPPAADLCWFSTAKSTTSGTLDLQSKRRLALLAGAGVGYRGIG